MDKSDFIGQIKSSTFLNGVRAIFHQGACSATTEWDGQFVMKNNYDYSKSLLHCCIENNIPFIFSLVEF
jgi:ADP-L-glycero-D-manno-heptose 6-epimerase